MRRALRWLGWIAAVLIGVPLLLVVLLFAVLNTGAGQRAATALVNRAAGGTATIAGLHGFFPDRLRIGRITLRDAKGPYAVIDDAAIDWAPWKLVGGDAAIRRLAAAQVAVLRRPVPAAGGSASAQSSSALPVRVDIDALRIDRLTLAAPVAGVAAAMALTGSLHLANPGTGSADITLHRLDAPGDYHLAGRIDPSALSADLTAEEPAQGFIARVARLPGLGALSVRATLDGPWSGAAAQASVAAGPLRAAAHGRIAITGKTADLDLTATAPAMAPRPDTSWQSVSFAAHVTGPFAAPQGTGTLRITGLAAASARIADFAADFTGNAGHATIAATATGVAVPGPKPALLGTAPLVLHADADLHAAGTPVRFALTGSLLALTGTATLGTDSQVRAHLDLPDLAPLAAAYGQDLAGHAALDVTARQDADGGSATVTGTVGITGGTAPLPALIGPDAHIAVAAALHGATVTLSRLQVNGSRVTLGAQGGLTGGKVLTLDWQAALPDLSVIAATVQGSLRGHGHVAGPLDDLAAQADLSGEVASAQVPRGPLTVSLTAQGLPGRPTGHVTAQGMLDGAPLALDASADRAADGTLHVAIARAAWKSAHAEGAFTLAPGATLPVGTLALTMTRLDDLSRLAGRPLSGGITATAAVTRTGGHEVGHLTLDARGAGMAGTASVASAKLDATLRDPTGTPSVDAKLAVSGLRAGGIGGDATMTAAGPAGAVALRLQSSLAGVGGAPLQASGAATLDATGQRVTLSALQAVWKGETLRLLAPARVTFGRTVAVDRLRLGVQQAVLDVAGRLSPTLDLTASLHNVHAAMANPFVTGLKAQGVLDADARLTGSTARPAGRLHLAARGLRLRGAGMGGLPAADLTADATLAGTSANLTVRATAGSNRVTLAGSLPIPGSGGSGAMQLRAAGTLDLATLNPLLTASGRHVLGRATLDASITGTPAAPRANGTLVLADGVVQDYAFGAHVSDLAARIEADGDTIRITRFTGRAGKGTIGASGTVGLGGALPVDLRLTAHKATPLASDRMTATMDADLTLRGDLRGQLAAGGTLTIDGAEIRIPDKLPASIAVLDVRRPGQAPPPPPAPPPDIALDITVRAPGQAFIRGRGLFAEVAGRIKVGGTAARPVPVGVFRLRRGTFDLAGTTLTFTSGDVRFEGGGTLDPALHLVASSSNGSITATLTVGGFASAPKITLSSSPPLPQDEVLAQLLFHQSASTLTPLQLASAAAALAQISGVGGNALNPLEGVRKSLGLDRLTVGGGQNGSGPSVEAGRYLARGVYVGAKQAAQGSGSQASVQIDLMRGLKLETDVGTGGQTSATGAAATATANPYGTSVGLTYQFQY